MSLRSILGLVTANREDLPAGGAATTLPGPVNPDGAQLPTAPAAPAAPEAGGGIGQDLLQALPMIFAAIAGKAGGGPGGSGAFLQGVTQGMERRRRQDHDDFKAQYEQTQDTQARADLVAQRERQEQVARAGFETSAAAKLAEVDDPVDFEQLVNAYESAGVTAHGLPAGWLRSTARFSDTKARTKAQTEAAARLEALRKAGYDLSDERVTSGTSVTFRGRNIPIADLMVLAGAPTKTVAEPNAIPFGARGGVTSLETPRQVPVLPKAKADDRVTADSIYGDLLIDFREKHGRDPKPGRETVQLKAEAKKVIGQADDRPRITVQTSGTNSDAEAIADAIIAGDQPPTLTGLYRNAAPVRALLARKGYDLTRATQDWKATERYLSTLNGPQQIRLMQATEFVSHTVPLVQELSEQLTAKLPRGRFPILNTAALSAARNGVMGEEAQKIATTLTAQITDLQSELAVMYRGGNAPTDEAMKKADEMLQTNWSAAQLKAALDLIQRNVQIRLNSLRAVGVAGNDGNPYAPRRDAPPKPPAGGRSGGAGPAGLSYEDYLKSRGGGQ